MSARSASRPLTVAIVTGTRAEFGLLRPVMLAAQKHKRLKLKVIAAGAHFLPPARTIKEVEPEFTIAARVPMQIPGKTGRAADALATARGIDGFARAYAKLKPDWVVVLGDRIEAFAAASAASIAGIAVCHIHGGDRAEGVADEAMRHAITKLSHLHCAATKLSAERIIKMGEKPEHVHVTGSPAIDGLRSIPRVTATELGIWNNVSTIFLLHPSGQTAEQEAGMVQTLIAAVDEAAPGDVLALAPNSDPGREIIWTHLKRRASTPNDRIRHSWHADGHATMQVLPRPSKAAANNIGNRRWFIAEHLPREQFVRVLKAAAAGHYGLLVGNSSAGLIEAAALGMYVLNVGDRQRGREQAGWIENVRAPHVESMISGINRLMGIAEAQRVPSLRRAWPLHPYGDGRSAPRIASLLARTNPHTPALLRKHNAY